MAQQTKKIIWLLSAYRSDSHASWVDWLLETFTQFEWHTLELPGRHFRWRIRGNPLSWLRMLPDEQPDLILATSMVDLSTLKGLHPRLAAVPCIYYFHENQFAYPVSDKQINSIEPVMVQLYGALCANNLVFNSAYNCDSFLDGIDRLLKRLPDETPEGVAAEIRQKSEVLPVFVNSLVSDTETGEFTKNRRLILWNHRWEYDKAPQVFVEALISLNERNPDFELALLGSRTGPKPEALQQIEDVFGDKIVVSRKVSREEYRQYLLQSSIVVSTAIHEFQGLSVMEAVTAGAVPLVPDDLCYREQYDKRYRYRAGDSDALAGKLSQFLTQDTPLPDIAYWYSETLKEEWMQLLERHGN